MKDSSDEIHHLKAFSISKLNAYLSMQFIQFQFYYLYSITLIVMKIIDSSDSIELSESFFLNLPHFGHCNKLMLLIVTNSIKQKKEKKKTLAILIKKKKFTEF